MTILDISSMNLDSYSSEEIVGYGRAGVLYCQGVDLSELVEKLIEDRDGESKFTQADLDDAHQSGYDDGVGACRGAIENL
ncbi:MAG: hypothetical protein EOO06_00985 [Chitinophagaceae bacterium]|nr:MAG: hypothetical protein EOO06_00985 [Chitinophagaceae bacterium]